MRRISIFILIFSLLVPLVGAEQGDLTLDKKAREFLTDLKEGRIEKARVEFDSTMKEKLPPSRLEKIWDNLQVKYGKFRKLGESRRSSSGRNVLILTDCHFQEKKIVAKVVFDGLKRIAGLYFMPSKSKSQYKAPSYVNKKDFIEKKIEFGKENWKLRGALTIPKGVDKYPVVILVHGSGPHDLDETIGPNKPFRDIAWGLSSKGIAVFRYDKRTYTYKDRADSLNFTVKNEVITDALEAIEIVKTLRMIDTNRIFLLGHSLGGKLAPEIAAQTNSLSGLILMAANSRPITELIVEQTKYLTSRDGKVSGDEKRKFSELKAKVRKLQAGEFPREQKLFGASGQYWYSLLNRKPLKLAPRLSLPMYILQGGRDYQVTTKDFKGWKRVLGEKKTTTFKLYPKLNHLFIAGNEKSYPSEYRKPGHVSQRVIRDITKWIKDNSEEEGE